MRDRSVAACFIALAMIILVMPLRSLAEDGDLPIHPTNKILIKMYPRPYGLRYPDVPRITAPAALNYYENGKALFIHVGVDAPNLLGGLNHEELAMRGINLDKLKSIANKQAIITYCN